MATKVRQSPSREADAALSSAEWEARGREALVLECDNLDLEASGDASALAQRLYNHYHPAVVEEVEDDLLLSSQGSDSSDDSDSPDSRRKSREHKNNDDDDTEDPEEPKDAADQDTARNDGENVAAIGGPQDLEDTQDLASNNNLAASAFETAQANSELLKDLLDRIGLMNAERELTHAEVKALRSDFKSKMAAAVTAAGKAGKQIIANAAAGKK